MPRHIVYSYETGEVKGEIRGDIKDPAARQNKDFVMFFRRFIKDISDLSFENPRALSVLLFLVRNMDSTNAIGITQPTLAEMLKVSRPTVCKALNYLLDNGWIDRYKMGHEYFYIVNPEIAWTSYAKNKSCCKFNASVVLSSTDNWEVKTRTTRYVDVETLKQLADKGEIDG